jgi:hypothetical protein
MSKKKREDDFGTQFVIMYVIAAIGGSIPFTVLAIGGFHWKDEPFLIFLILMLLYVIPFAYVWKIVLKDAHKLGMRSSQWALFAAAVPVLGIMLYCTVRTSHKKTAGDAEDERPEGIDLNKFAVKKHAPDNGVPKPRPRKWGHGRNKDLSMDISVDGEMVALDEHGQITESKGSKTRYKREMRQRRSQSTTSLEAGAEDEVLIVPDGRGNKGRPMDIDNHGYGQDNSKKA